MELNSAQLHTQYKKDLLVSRCDVIEECGKSHGHNKHENIEKGEKRRRNNQYSKEKKK